MPSQAKNKSSSRTARLVTSSLFVTLALIFSYLEFVLPLFPTLPGVKLGIANLVILVCLYELGTGYSITINFIRIIISGLLFTGLFATLYSFAGAIIAMIFMIGLKKTGKFSIVGVSLVGAFGHSLGQIIIATILVNKASMFYYYPVLLFSSIATGVIMGFLAYWLVDRLPKNLF